jgi:hypothetical protein
LAGTENRIAIARRDYIEAAVDAHAATPTAVTPTANRTE